MGTTVIQPETLLCVVKKYFARISPVQWSLLAEGIMDSPTHMIIAEMCSEMTQTLVRDVLKQMLPFFFEPSMQNCPNMTKIHVELGHSINQAFAEALCTQPETCESTNELRALMEEEVMKRADMTLYRVADISSLPTDAAIFVHGTMSNVNTLSKMVVHVQMCLMVYLRKLDIPLCWQPETLETQANPESTVMIRHAGRLVSSHSATISSFTSSVNVPETRDAVAEILLEWCGKDVYQKVAEGARMPQKIIQRAHDTAADIIKIINHHPDSKEDSCSENSTSCGSHCNIKLILKRMKMFFASSVKKSNNQNVRKSRFFEFVGPQYNTMMEQLERFVENKDSVFPDFLVNLQSTHSPQRACFEESVESLPGAVPEFPRLQSRCSSSRFTVVKESPEPSVPVRFDIIQEDVMDLYDKLNQSPTSAKQMSTSDKIRFTRQLTNNIFDHLIPGEVYQLPAIPLHKHLSDFVISTSVSSVSDGLRISPEVLYAITEHTVCKIVQLVELWLQMAPVQEMCAAEELSGALKDLHKLMTAKVTPVEKARDTTDHHIHLSVELTAHHLDDVYSVDPVGLAKLLVAELVIKLISYLPRKVRKSLKKDKITAVITRQIGEVLEVVNISLFTATQHKHIAKKVIKSVIKDVIKHYGSPELAMEVVVHSNQFFNDVVIQSLKIHLVSFQHLKKSRAHKFFSVFCKVLAWPFIAFIPTTGMD